MKYALAGFVLGAVAMYFRPTIQAKLEVRGLSNTFPTEWLDSDLYNWEDDGYGEW